MRRFPDIICACVPRPCVRYKNRGAEGLAVSPAIRRQSLIGGCATEERDRGNTGSGATLCCSTTGSGATLFCSTTGGGATLCCSTTGSGATLCCSTTGSGATGGLHVPVRCTCPWHRSSHECAYDTKAEVLVMRLCC